MSLYVVERQFELQTATAEEDMEPEECESYEEDLLQSIIEASLKESEDDIVEIDPDVAPVRPRPMFNVDEEVMNDVLFEEMDEDKIRRFENIYGTLASINIKEMKEHLKKRKVIHQIEEPIKPINLFPKIDHRLMKQDQ